MARLYFEVVTNVGNQFHSKAENLLVIIFGGLDNRKWSDSLFTLCESLVSNLISFVSPKTNVSPIWKSLLVSMNALVRKICKFHFR